MTKEEKAVIKAAMSWAYTFNRGGYGRHLEAGAKLREACAALKKTKRSSGKCPHGYKFENCGICFTSKT
jgi:hypothetical protein